MALFVMILSRLVPIMMLLSLTLVGSRYIYDLVLPRRPRLAPWAFAAVSLIGLIATAPYVWRAALVVGGHWAVERSRFQLADILLADYDAWGGRTTDTVGREWAYARMNLGHWKDAEEALLKVPRPSAQSTLLIGLCRYYLNDPAAEATLLRIPDVLQVEIQIRDYLLARIAQKRGDITRAYNLYWRAASIQPHFLPAVYHGARLTMLAGDADAALRIVNAYARQFPGAGTNPDVLTLRSYISSGRVPPDKEYEIVAF
ncbi:MAG TPA: hypothetical protein VGS96_06875 [Thermoanaerobaculia bacterium]|jgi:tetratricopeptide (TPR) repeat protein|nr:hypothetical protein [Thermoanaerobaculia bacterium]